MHALLPALLMLPLSRAASAVAGAAASGASIGYATTNMGDLQRLPAACSHSCATPAYAHRPLRCTLKYPLQVWTIYTICFNVLASHLYTTYMG
jgi:hypothetical protein